MNFDIIFFFNWLLQNNWVPKIWEDKKYVRLVVVNENAAQIKKKINFIRCSHLSPASFFHASFHTLTAVFVGSIVASVQHVELIQLVLIQLWFTKYSTTSLWRLNCWIWDSTASLLVVLYYIHWIFFIQHPTFYFLFFHIIFFFHIRFLFPPNNSIYI